MKCAIIINQPRDILMAESLIMSAPPEARLTLITSRFNALDEFGWKKKRKNLDVYLNDHAVKLMREGFNIELIDCRSAPELKIALANVDVCFSRGREFFVVKSPARLNVAISADRCYINRLLDAIPFYGDRLKIVLDSDVWLESLDETSCHVDLKYGPSIDRNPFLFCDLIKTLADFWKKRGKALAKEALGLEQNKQSVMVSLRTADAALTLHSDNTAHFECIYQTLKQFKEEGYSIISRRRLGDFDVMTRMSSPEISRFDELSSLVDVEVNSGERIPDMMFAALTAADVLVLSDVSSIADTEAALARCPVYVPLSDGIERLRSLEALSPRFNEFVNEGLVLAGDRAQGWLGCGKEFVKSTQENSIKFVDRWFKHDATVLWSSVLDILA